MDHSKESRSGDEKGQIFEQATVDENSSEASGINKIDNDESSANFVRCQIILFHDGWDQAQKRMKLFHFSSGGSVATLGDKEWSLPLYE